VHHDGDLMLDEGDFTLDADYQHLVTVSMMQLLTVCDIPESHLRIVHG